MDTLLLEYKLKSKGIDTARLLKEMGWSEGTRQTRCIRGENWRLDEAKTLLSLGFTWGELGQIFLGKDYQV